MWQSTTLKDGTTLINALFGYLRLWLYIYSIIKNIKHMKNFIAINVDDGRDYFVTDNLNELIKDIYESELNWGEPFETVKGYFFNNYIVFESGSEISEIDSPLFV